MIGGNFTKFKENENSNIMCVTVVMLWCYFTQDINNSITSTSLQSFGSLMLRSKTEENVSVIWYLYFM